MSVLANVTCVAIEGRGLLIEGPPGSGKSSLAIALIDRGAVLVGDDGVSLERQGAKIWAHPPPHIAGKLEIRGVGIVDLPVVYASLALVLSLEDDVTRLPEADEITLEGVRLPRLRFRADGPHSALRAEWALRLHGLPRSNEAM
jgi:serine kinase of HPr protein (carbohydrate metabolism regulator)